MSKINCHNCGKENESLNFCNWDCHIIYVKKNGGEEHLPNSLPIQCITRDGLMLENEHGNHEDYKFPINV